MNAKNVRAAIERMQRQQSAAGEVFSMLLHPLDSLALLGHIGEEATRYGVFRRAYEAELAKGVRPQAALEAAGLQSAESTIDFRRFGMKTRALNQIIPFFNPGFQGTDRFFRTWTDPVQTVVRGSLITSISLYLAWANQDDPRVRDLEDWQRAYFWLVPMGEMTTDRWQRMSPAQRATYNAEHPIFRIPKPFVWGQVFGTLPEMLFERTVRNNPQAFDRIGESLSQGFGIGYTPALLTPLVENAVNYSFFRDRPVVPKSLEGLAPQEQATAYTPEPYKMVARVAAPFRDVPVLGQLASPLKLQHLVEGTTGTGGREVVAIADRLMQAAGVAMRPEMTPRFADYPLIGGAAARSGQSQAITDFYKSLEKSREAAATFRAMRQEPTRLGEAKQFHTQHAGELAHLSAMETLAGQLSQLRKVQEKVRVRPDLTPEARRQMVDTLQQQAAELAQQAMGRLRKSAPSPPVVAGQPKRVSALDPSMAPTIGAAMTAMVAFPPGDPRFAAFMDELQDKAPGEIPRPPVLALAKLAAQEEARVRAEKLAALPPGERSQIEALMASLRPPGARLPA